MRYSIRPLVTEDRKKRRLSGRDQISSDGKHLIDGIAFGRPRLRTPRDRPTIEIPPLKRRRIAYDDEELDEADEDDDESPLLLTEHGEKDEDDDPDSARVTVVFDDLDRLDDMELEDDEDEDFDEGAAEDADDDVDADAEDIDESELEDELRYLQEENAKLRDSFMDDEAEKEQEQQLLEPELPEKHDVASAQPAALDLPTLDKITALRAAFPDAPVTLCEKTLLGCNKSPKRAYNQLRKTHMPALSLHGMYEHEKRLQSGATARTWTNTGDDDAMGEDDGDLSGSDAESVSSLIKHYDQHGFPAGTVMDGSASAHMAEMFRKSGQEVKMPVHTRFGAEESPEPENVADDAPMDELASDDEESSSASDFEEEDSASDDGDSDESDDDDFDPSQGNTKGDPDSDEGSDSGPEEESSKPKREPKGGVKVSEKRRYALESENDGKSEGGAKSDNDSSCSSDSGEDGDNSGNDSSNDSSSESDSDSDSSDDGETGGTGLKKTIVPSAGESSSSESSSDESSSDDSDSDSDSDKEQEVKQKTPTLTDASTRVATVVVPKASNVASTVRRQTAPVDTTTPVPPLHGLTSTQRRNARRRAKNKAVKAAANGAPDHECLSPIAPQETLLAKKAALLERLKLLDEPVTQNTPSQASGAKKTDTPRSASRQSPSEASASSQRKSKLDLGAGRRMLFGSLGLKNPKTKADEDKIRDSLMKDVRVHTNARLESPDKAGEHKNSCHSPAQEEDTEAWREKIVYKAVECCEEDIDLSEPPFPFVQRWDPQQRWGKGRGKRKQRNNEEFYEEDTQPSSKKRKYADQYEQFEDSYLSAANEATSANITLNYDDEPEPESMDTDHIEDTEVVDDEDDLPSVPDDLSVLPVAQAGNVKPGMVLTWKQFLLSKATNWQPQVLSMTGSVTDVYDNDSLLVRLAKRDRNLDRNEAIYDDDGKRVYDKFELPGMDDEMDDDEGLGYRTIFFDEIIDPRVLQGGEQKDPDTQSSEQQAGSAHSQDISKPAQPEVSRSATDLSATLDHEPSQDKQQGRMDVDAQHTGETVIPETILETTEPRTATDVSITEERLRETSEMNNEAGFRKEVDPSVEQQKDDLSSPSRQLDDEMSQERTFEDTTTGTVIAPSFSSNAPPASSPRSHRDHLEPDTQPASLGATNGTFRSDDVQSQLIVLEPFNGFSDEPSSDPFPSSRAGYPRLDVLHSDSGSVVSGRQPDPGFSFQSVTDNHIDQSQPDSREVVPETSGAAPSSGGERESSPVLNDTVPNSPVSAILNSSVSVSSMNSFPSLSEVFVTASTSESARTPSKAAIMSALQARKSAVSPDLGYKEEMRRLDEVGDTDEASDDGEESGADEDEDDENDEEEDEISDEADEDQDGEDDKADEDDSVDDGFNEGDTTFMKEGLSNQKPQPTSYAQLLAQRAIEKPEKPAIIKIKKEISQSQIAKTVLPKFKPVTRVPRESPLPRPRMGRSSQPPSSFIPPGSQVIVIPSSPEPPEPEIVEHYANNSIDGTYEESQMPNGSGWVSKAARRGVSVPASSVPRQQAARKPSASQGRTLASSRPRKTMARVL